MATRKVRLANGVTLHCVANGPDDGDPVLMLHGLSDTSFSFSRVLPLMPASLRVLVPDKRGHGASDRPEGACAMDVMAEDAVQLLDAFAISRATVVGHSMGSFIARRMAARAPGRVRRLVLVGAGPTARNQTLVELNSVVETLRDPVDPGFVRAFQEGTVNRPLPEPFMERVIADSGRMPARVWKAALAGMMDYAPAETDLRCPTLILGGDCDAVFSRAEHEQLARLIGGSTVRIFPGIGHALHWEDPEAFLRELF